MLQILINTLIYSGEIGIIAVGVALSYSVLRFANFAHIQFAVVGAYLAFTLNQFLHCPLVLAVILAAVLTGGIAVTVDALVFSRLRDVTPEGKMIVSWGVALLLRSTMGAIFGSSSRVFGLEPASLQIGDAFFTSLDVVVVVVAILAMILLHFLLYSTRLGTALRALASNADLAATRGIPARRMVSLMWFICGAYAAIGGSLFALESQLAPNMDLIILLPVFASVTLGGLSNVFGAALGALGLSLAQNLLIGVDFGSWFSANSWSVPTQFRDFIAVGAMVIILLLRPYLARRRRAV
ncbi:branched-chain amino acid ABC transporter permease [Acidisoma silvae]|uniref:Branched-chain amino acid ABC transporter permease n=1 Tax=Acidisoma silvae TaxID=2802396 RepID=A0A963YWD5_9PROT|nr:branched-chain amino acid ABC transporter permease [Acidisoma silvae]MCB8878064.1 branched-chain amino acid ABC transporter permease [Acidisoma silvae]